MHIICLTHSLSKNANTLFTIQNVSFLSGIFKCDILKKQSYFFHKETLCRIKINFGDLSFT